MTDASIALNRFGMGARPGESAGRDPRQWLKAQLDRFDPTPQPAASLTPSTQIVADFAQYQEQQRLLRQEYGPRRQPVGAARPAAVQPPAAQSAPAMQEGATMQPGAAMTASVPAPETMAPSRQQMPLNPLEESRRQARRQAQDRYVLAVSTRALLAITSPTPFAERLSHFWANHFAVSADKLELIGLAGTLEFEAIRPHVMGKFGDMLNAVERHPAMLLYLDQAQSIGPNSPAGLQAQRRGNNRRAGLNENLAREIMELHTLGVRSVYNQADVTEFARAMTGFTVNGLGRARDRAGPLGSGPVGSFLFLDRIHEPGTRTILGKSWREHGEAQAGSVLDFYATHPATAKHIAAKLARHFAADDPPPALVARLQQAFLSSGGDLPTVYRALIDSPECWTPQPAKFKSPWEWSISAMRALGTQQVQPQAVNGLMNQLGQPVWKPGSPAGWDDVAGAWAGPDAVMRRVEAAERMAQRSRDTIDARQRAAELFPGALSEGTAQSIARAESPGQGLALMLVSPEFMRR